MKGGSKPHPQLHVVPEGGTPPSRQRRRGAGAVPGRPREPRWREILGIDEPDLVRLARRTWRTLVRELHLAGRLATMDTDALEDYCVCRARIRGAERELSEGGLVLDGPRGPIKNPAATIASQYRTRLKTLEEQIGIGALNRLRLPEATPPEDGDDDLDAPVT